MNSETTCGNQLQLTRAELSRAPARARAGCNVGLPLNLSRAAQKFIVRHPVFPFDDGPVVNYRENGAPARFHRTYIHGARATQSYRAIQ